MAQAAATELKICKKQVAFMNHLWCSSAMSSEQYSKRSMDHLWCSSSMSSQQYSKRSSPTGSASLWDRPATLHLAQGQTGVQRLQVFPFNKHSSCNHLLWPWLYIISIPNIIWLYRVDVKRRLNAPYQKEQVHVSSASLVDSSHSDTFFMFRVNLWSCRRLWSRKSSPLQWSMSPTGFKDCWYKNTLL